MHSLTGLIINDVVSFSMIAYSTNQSSASIFCETSLLHNLVFEDVAHIYVMNLDFFGCERDIINIKYIPDITLIRVSGSTLILLKCIFEEYKTISVISTAHSNITIVKVLSSTILEASTRLELNLRTTKD